MTLDDSFDTFIKPKMPPNFHDVMANLIAWNKKIRSDIGKTSPGLMETVGWNSYCQDFCTVQANAGRRTGKSTFIRHAAKEGDVIVVSNMALFRNFHGFTSATVMIFEQVLHHRDRLKAATVFVDEPSLVLHMTSISTLYGAFERNPDITFVLVGA